MKGKNKCKDSVKFSPKVQMLLVWKSASGASASPSSWGILRIGDTASSTVTFPCKELEGYFEKLMSKF